MKSKFVLGLSIQLMILFLFNLNATGDNSLPDVFEFRFPHVDDIRIYSGTVKFAHKAHFSGYRISCVRCHHNLEFGAERVNTRCRECHSNEGFPRFEEAERLTQEEKNQYYLVVLHAQCIGCHIDTRQNQRQSMVPISCTRCHLR